MNVKWVILNKIYIWGFNCSVLDSPNYRFLTETKLKYTDAALHGPILSY